MSEDPLNYPTDRVPQPGEPSAESLAELLTRYWGLLRRFYWILLLAAVAGVVGAYLWTERQPRIYEATSKLMFLDTQPNVLGGEFEEVEFIDPGRQFEEFWNTQRELLDSRWFVEDVVRNEGLADDPRLFDPELHGKLSDEERERMAVASVRNAANYSLQRDSHVALVRMRFQDPELAAQVANAVTEAYVEYLHDYQSGGLEQLVNWFDDYVLAQREELDSAHAELQEYQRDHEILSLTYEDRREMTKEALASVSARLRDVEADLYSEEALLHQIEEMEASGDDLRALADLADNTLLMEALREKKDLKRTRANLTTRYLDDHPRVKAVDNELEAVELAIEDEIGRVHASVENRVAIIRRNVENLERERARLTDEIARLNEIGLDYYQLRDNSETMRQHYETVLGRTTELDLNALYEREFARILEDAEAPGTPVSPQVPLNLAIGLLLGLFFGGAVVVFIDALDNTIKHHEDIARHTDRPVLGSLPAIGKVDIDDEEIGGDSPADTLTHTAPRSAFAEAIKTLRANLVFAVPDDPPKVIAITSPGPKDGKTVTATNLAIAFAQSGEETILIDADMRKPRVHRALGVDYEDGLSRVITAKADIDDAIESTGIDDLDVLCCGELPPNPSELLHSTGFEEAVAELRERYDRVVIDSPPLAAVADALVLSPHTDALLLILRAAQTRRELLARSIEQLNAINAPLVGTVLNDVDHTNGYGYTRYYHYRYETPEQDDEDTTRLAS